MSQQRLKELKMRLKRTSSPSTARRHMSLVLGASAVTALGALALNRQHQNKSRGPPNSSNESASAMLQTDKQYQSQKEARTRTISVTNMAGAHIRDVRIEELGQLKYNCGVYFVLSGDTTHVYTGIELQEYISHQKPGKHAVMQVLTPVFHVIPIHFWAHGSTGSIEEFQGVVCSPPSKEKLKDEYIREAERDRFENNKKLHSGGLENTVSSVPSLGFAGLTQHISQVIAKALCDQFPDKKLNQGTPAQDVPFVQMNVLTIRSECFRNRYVIVQGSCYGQQFYYTCGSNVFARSQEIRNNNNKSLAFVCRSPDGTIRSFSLIGEPEYSSADKELLADFCSDMLWKYVTYFYVTYETFAREVYPAANYKQIDLKHRPKTGLDVNITRAAICSRRASVDNVIPQGIYNSNNNVVSKKNIHTLWSYVIQDLGGFEECFSFLPSSLRV